MYDPVLLVGNSCGAFYAQMTSAPKPAPDMVLGILDQLGISENETMVIGDTTFDIEMGNKAHCWTCAVTYGNHTRERLMTAQPNFIVDSFSEVLSCKNDF